MNVEHGLKTIIIGIVLAVFLLPGVVIAEDVNWVTYDKAMTMAKKQDKPILVYFFTKWCGYCRKMDKEVFKDAPVVKYLNEKFISVRLDTEKNDKNKKIASSYKVRSYPSTWFLKSDGAKISNLPGFVPATSMINILKFLGSGSYEKMSFQDFLAKP
ncbi:MAG: hypothetical protein B6I31_00525 [Desulfobacteraceae bacterium 4572_19]|nr:MAG: hypothetical protein B6I31_00525 [Desulfobacteraceae bacterium 4572_19]